MIAETRVGDIVPPPDTKSFEVRFRDGENGHFVWRQANGLRRWHYWRVINNGIGGNYTIESGFHGGSDASDARGCIWTDSRERGSYYAGCSSGVNESYGGIGAIVNVLGAKSTTAYDGETIAGVASSCLALHDAAIFSGEFCFDPSSGIPLHISVVSTLRPSLTVDLIAEGPPRDISDIPRSVTGSFEGTTSTEALGLPVPLD